MTTEKIHCHPTIILEKAGGLLIAWVVILFSQAEGIAVFLIEEGINQDSLPLILCILGLMLLIPLLVTGYQFLVWRKTWIYMDGTAFIIERNTLNRKKNTYSIAHISNINMEQNLFELLMHTCRLKLDMENASDADSTDISILLSLQKAEELKSQLLSGSQGGEHTAFAMDGKPAERSYASFPEILSHCIYSLPGYYLVFLGCFTGVLLLLLSAGEVGSLSDLLYEEGEGSFFMKVFAAGIFIFTYGYQIIKRLMAFYHFTAYRQGNDIIIHYGFFRKQDYTIPVGRIHALRIVQPPIARLMGRAEARIVCVGIGDSEEELTQLSLCRKKEDLFQCLAGILPEFPAPSLNHMHRPPKHAGKLYACSCLCWIGICCLLPYAVTISLGFMETQWDTFLLYAYLWLGGLLVLYHLLRYSCIGFYGESAHVLFSGGSLTKTAMVIPYSHIQHLCVRQNPLSRYYGLYRGDVYILASVVNREVGFSYITEGEKDLLVLKMKKV